MIKHNRFWWLLTLASAGLLWIVFRFEPLRAIKLGALLGTGFLGLTLVPNNSITWVPSSFQTLRQLLKWALVKRRDFGITSGIIFIVHALMSWIALGNLSVTFLFSQPILFGVVGLIILGILLLTSNDYSVHVLRRKWKVFHNLIWVAIPFLLLHSVLAATIFSGEYSKIGILGFGGLIGLVLVEVVLKLCFPKRVPASRWDHIKLVTIGVILAMALFVVYPSNK